MNVVFVGGGSYRILPIMRALLDHRPIFGGGSIRLVDRVPARAEAVATMVQRAPEFRGSGCQVRCSTDLERELDGADILYVTMAAGAPLAALRSGQVSRKYGFLSSDQLSLTGSFFGLSLGPTILKFARMMEQRCPQAKMLIFANPVAVYSGLVNNHTTIRALGICGGFSNHRWDITRMFGRDAYCDTYDVDVAGVNHCSLLLRGRWQGKDLLETLKQHVNRKGWKPPKIAGPHQHLAKHIAYALQKLKYMLNRYGTMIFSTEGDGMAHLFFEEMFAMGRAQHKTLTAAQMNAAARRADRGRRDMDARFAEFLTKDLSPEFWQTTEDRRFARADSDVTIPILKALAGMGACKIAASRPSRGSVKGFKDRTVLEYSMTVDADGFHPAGTYEIPDAFHGLMSGLATHQTLVGDAIATADPRVLADALYAYPMQQGSRNARCAARELLAANREFIPPVFQKARDYFRD